MKTRSDKVSTKWIYLIFAILVFAVLIWTSLQALRETPTREVSIQIPDQEWVTLSLTTNPFPPLPTGSVALTIRANSNRGVTVDLGEALPFSFGAEGSNEAFNNGEALWNGFAYQAGVMFPTPGNYWLNIDLSAENKAEFQLYVEPAQ